MVFNFVFYARVYFTVYYGGATNTYLMWTPRLNFGTLVKVVRENWDAREHLNWDAHDIDPCSSPTRRVKTPKALVKRVKKRSVELKTMAYTQGIKSRAWLIIWFQTRYSPWSLMYAIYLVALTCLLDDLVSRPLQMKRTRWNTVQSGFFYAQFLYKSTTTCW